MVRTDQGGDEIVNGQEWLKGQVHAKEAGRLDREKVAAKGGATDKSGKKEQGEPRGGTRGPKEARRGGGCSPTQ